MMGKQLTIYNKQGAVRYIVNKWSYNGSFMEGCSVSFDAESSSPIAWEIGDYLVYRGERFELNVLPAVKKQSSNNTYAQAYVYDSVKFDSLQDELSRCSFLDYVSNDNNLYTGLPKFSFYADSVNELAERIQANLDRVYKNSSKWTVSVSSEYTEKVDKNISVDNISCLEALALVNSQWKLNFVIKGRNITIASTGNAIGTIFKYGKSKGLVTLERQVDDNQAIITRLRAYGNTTNMPLHYYANVGKKAFFTINTFESTSISLSASGDVGFTKDSFTQQNSDGSFLVQFATFSNGEWGETFTAHVNAYDKDTMFSLNMNVSYTDEEKFSSFVSLYQSGARKFYFISGYNINYIPAGNIDVTSVYTPDNYSVNRLMLPAFPNVSLDPYIDSDNIYTLGVREGSVYFDGSDDREDIYPTIDGMTGEDLRSAGIECHSDGSLNVIVSAQQISDTGVFADNETIDNFTIKLKDLGFNIKDYVLDTPYIEMKSGMCTGRKFEIANCVQNADYTYTITCKRTKDEDLELYFPYSRYNLASGDSFVLTGISMPDVYVQAASQRLLTAATSYLSANDYTRYTYSPTVDNLYLQREYDSCADKTTSIYWTLKEGDILSFYDADLGIEGDIIIDSLTIKEGESLIPQYEISLKDEKTVGTLERIQNTIDSMVSGGGTGGGYSMSQIRNVVKNFGKQLFLSRTEDDFTIGNITFKGTTTFDNSVTASGGINYSGSIKSSDYSSGELGTGTLLGKYAGTSDTYLEIDRILVRKMAQFVELAIKRLSHVGGSIVVSPAELTISKVEEQTNTYRCYIDTTDGNTTVKLDEWSVGDLARCQTFNLNTNTYYWRAVTSVDSTNGYIELSKTDCDSGSGVPKRGDVLVALGNKTDSTRQNAIVLASTGTSAPSIKVYHGISSYSLTDKDATSIEYDTDKGRMSFKVYGDMYIGNRDESNYIKFDQDEGIKMRVSEFSVKVTDEEGEESYQELDEIVKKVSQQTDGYFLVWRSSTDDVPSATIEPEKDWTTDAMKSEHVGDIYLNSDGLCWEYTHIENVGYYWTAVSDAYLISALNKVNSKARCFVGVYGTDTPTSGDYTKNDMWVNATYGTNYNKEMLVCIKNGSWDSFKISDWALANAYSATLSNFISNTYNQFISDIQQQVDGKAESWSQSTDPSVAWTTDALKASHVGDIWYDTTNNVSKIWNGTSWDTSDVDLSGLTDDIDGKASIYVGATPNTPYKANDLWILPANKTVNNTAYKKGSILISSSDSDSYVQSHWAEKVRYTDDSALTNFINNTYNVFVEEINSQIDGKAESYFQSADPADSWTNAHSEHKGDVWVKLDPDDKSYMASYIYDGTQWIEQTINLQPLVDKVDGKASIYVSQPKSYEARDLWILSAQTTVNGKVYEKGTILISSSTSTEYDPTHWSKEDCYTNGMNSTEKTNLLETGIDISNKKITVTAESFKVQDTQGNKMAVFEKDTNGTPYIKADLIKTNKVSAYDNSGTLVSEYNGNGEGTIVYYYPNGNKMREDVFLKDDNGEITGMRTYYYDSNGNVAWYISESGTFENPNVLDYYWSTWDGYKMTTELAEQLGGSHPSTVEQISTFSTFASNSAQSSAIQQMNGFTCEGRVNAESPSSKTPFSGLIYSSVYQATTGAYIYRCKQYVNGYLQSGFYEITVLPNND